MNKQEFTRLLGYYYAKKRRFIPVKHNIPSRRTSKTAHKGTGRTDLKSLRQIEQSVSLEKDFGNSFRYHKV